MDQFQHVPPDMEEIMCLSKDWTVKVNADVAFLPMKVCEKLNVIQVTPIGNYRKNYKFA